MRRGPPFLVVAAHELRNPMTPIIGHVEPWPARRGGRIFESSG